MPETDANAAAAATPSEADSGGAPAHETSANADANPSASPAASAPSPDAGAPSDAADKPAETKSEAQKPEGDKPADAPSAPSSLLGADDGGKEPQKPAQPEQPQDRPAAPTFQPFTLPEGVTVEQVKVGEFSKTLGEGLSEILAARQSGDEAAVAKADQALGQKLVDFHIGEMKAHAERQAQANVDSWNKMVLNWQDAVRKDPEIGGNKYETSLKHANAFLREYGGSADQIKELNNALQMTGAGSNPAIVRLLAKAGAVLAREGEAVAGQPAVPQPKSRAERRYTKMNGKDARASA